MANGSLIADAGAPLSSRSGAMRSVCAVVVDLVQGMEQYPPAVKNAHVHADSEKNADRVGIFASSLCAVHCIAGAIMAGASGFGRFLQDERLEWAFVGTALIVATWALVRGFRRHGDPLPMRIFFVALIPVLLARTVPWPGVAIELTLSVLGAASLISAHVLNLRALGRCGCASAKA